MVDWSKLPDVGAVAFLTCAFAAVARRSQTPVSGIWLTGWIMIVIHFAAFFFAPLPGFIGSFAAFIGLVALAWAGLLFMRAAVPYRNQPSTRWIFASLFISYTLYITVICYIPASAWVLIPSALLFAVAPLVIALFTFKQVNDPLRWIVLIIHVALSCFLLAFQQHPGNGPDFALNALFFAVYFGCCLHFWYAHRRMTAGAFITTAAFLSWSAVFIISPSVQALLPSVHLENEVWNLPKYVVAIGMILVVLEEQIEHNKHLALHDELTGLPNRRLFQDRLNHALDHARRTGSQAALLLIDLDHFKQINDTVGHHVGDLVLQRASSVFQARIRHSDTVARTGGDEFSIILEGPTNQQDAEHVARSLIQLLNEPLNLAGNSVKIGASVGIALFPEDAETPETLRIAADLRMYERKFESRTTSFTPAVSAIQTEASM